MIQLKKPVKLPLFFLKLSEFEKSREGLWYIIAYDHVSLIQFLKGKTQETGTYETAPSFAWYQLFNFQPWQPSFAQFGQSTGTAFPSNLLEPLLHL